MISACTSGSWCWLKTTNAEHQRRSSRMSGHSKWATIKHKKGAADAKRGKLFAKLIKQVEVAARQGGGDPDSNPTLRTMFQKARDSSVPLDTIERAVKRGTGELEGVEYEQVTYEGYAPNGVALYVEVLTDNRNRSGSEIRTVLTKNGGSLAEPGAVAWQFERKGVVVLPRTVDEDELMLVALDAGAEDLVDEGDTWRLTSGPSDLPAVREALESAEVPFDSADLTMLPSTTVELSSTEAAKAVLRLIDLLDDHDDVQDVYANFDIPDEILQTVSA
jgi:YebC/PmpR family DNA-binding regulatory protein